MTTPYERYRHRVERAKRRKMLAECAGLLAIATSAVATGYLLLWLIMT